MFLTKIMVCRFKFDFNGWSGRYCHLAVCIKDSVTAVRWCPLLCFMCSLITLRLIPWRAFLTWHLTSTLKFHIRDVSLMILRYSLLVCSKYLPRCCLLWLPVSSMPFLQSLLCWNSTAVVCQRSLWACSILYVAVVALSFEHTQKRNEIICVEGSFDSTLKDSYQLIYKQKKDFGYRTLWDTSCSCKKLRLVFPSSIVYHSSSVWLEGSLSIPFQRHWGPNTFQHISLFGFPTGMDLGLKK